MNVKINDSLIIVIKLMILWNEFLFGKNVCGFFYFCYVC